MSIFNLSFKSLLNRKISSFLAIFSIASSVALYISIEKIREGAKNSFSNTLSQTDLIVGAKGGTVQLLLYTVFRVGNATNNVSFSSYNFFKNHPAVSWTIPFSLGDSHRGYRVVGTTIDFFSHYRFYGDKKVEIKEGLIFEDIFDVCLGFDVAKNLSYKVGDAIVVSHGVSSEGEGFLKHDDKPFKVSCILQKTGTPLDRALYISLEAMEAIHMDWADGAPPSEKESSSKEHVRELKKNNKIEVGQITSFLLRTKTRIEVLRLQREINDYEKEPLMAIIPAVALNELWGSLSYAENSLRLVSLIVALISLLSILITQFSSLNERRREIAIFRALGASPRVIFFMLILESFVLCLMGILGGLFLSFALLQIFSLSLEQNFNVLLSLYRLEVSEWSYLIVLIVLGSMSAIFPAIKAYRNSLSDGLTIKI